jgi:hypothetical protein
MRIDLEHIIGNVEVKVEGNELKLSGQIDLSVAMAGETTPDAVEQSVEETGQAIKRVLFRALMEQADREAVLRSRAGKEGQGIQCRGSRPYSFRTVFGTVEIQRSRISHRAGAGYEFPSQRAWNLPAKEYVTRGLRDLAWDEMMDRPLRSVKGALDQRSGQQDLLAESSILEIVHQEGKELGEAVRQRAKTILAAQPEVRKRLAPACDGYTRQKAKQRGEPVDCPVDAVTDEDALKIAMGFLGAESPEELEEQDRVAPRQVDEGFVLMQADEVKTKAQGSCPEKELWFFTAVIMVGQMSYHVVAETTEELWEQSAALLHLLGISEGKRQLIVLADGARWIRNWFTSIDAPGKVMILCWYHLAKRVYQRLSAAGFAKQRREELEKELLGHLWRGRLDAALEVYARIRDEARNPRWVDDMVNYLKKRREYIPNYEARHQAGLWIASNRVEKWNDWAVSERCKRRGMSWVKKGVMALALRKAARHNGELDDWQKTRTLPDWRVPQSAETAA